MPHHNLGFFSCYDETNLSLYSHTTLPISSHIDSYFALLLMSVAAAVVFFRNISVFMREWELFFCSQFPNVGHKALVIIKFTPELGLFFQRAESWDAGVIRGRTKNKQTNKQKIIRHFFRIKWGGTEVWGISTQLLRPSVKKSKPFPISASPL